MRMFVGKDYHSQNLLFKKDRIEGNNSTCQHCVWVWQCLNPILVGKNYHNNFSNNTPRPLNTVFRFIKKMKPVLMWEISQWLQKHCYTKGLVCSAILEPIPFICIVTILTIHAPHVALGLKTFLWLFVGFITMFGG